MATVTHYDKKDEGYHGHCSKCGAHFTYSCTEVYKEYNGGLFNFGKSYIYCPNCREKTYVL